MKPVLSLLLLLLVAPVQAQPTPWKGRQCAVVLTYDDALPEHLTNALPVLDSLGLTGTFYLTDIAGTLQAQIPAWREAAARGHELGNHTLTHPCEGGRPGREFVRPDTDLTNYSLQRISADIKAMNALLFAIDGKTKRTFAYPCGDTKAEGTPYIDGFKNTFAGARGVRASLASAAETDRYNIPAFVVTGQTGDQLIARVKEAEAKRGLLVFCFHGVGGGHGLNVSLSAHRTLLRYLRQRQKDIWIAPVVEVSTFIEEQQAGP